MRYPPDHRQKTYERILDAAAVVFRRHGYQASSVDQVMNEAGLTPGGFYAHFDSKEELFAQAFLKMLRQGRTLHGDAVEPLAGPARIQAIASRYLSAGHRKLIDTGCPLPPLLADLPRQSSEMRQAFQEVLREIAGEMASHVPAKSASPDADGDTSLALLAVMVGGMSLARGVADEALGDRILLACRKLIDAAVQSPTNSKPSIRSSRKKGQESS